MAFSAVYKINEEALTELNPYHSQRNLKMEN